MPEHCLPTIELKSDRLGRKFSLPVILGGLLACLTFCLCCTRFSDPDTWWHLKIGQEIWQTHSIPRADHWSFTVYGHSWTPHEWLSQLLLFTIYRVFGYAGLQLWLCLLASSIVAAGYALSYHYSWDTVVAALGGFLAFFFGTVGFSIRPQLIGYLLLTGELLVLLRAFRGKPRVLWWLPPLFLVWVNCHASYPLGLGIFGLTVVCRRWPERIALKAFALSCAVLLVNPLGWRMLLYPFDTFLNQRDNLAFVPEWQPPSLHDPRGFALLLVLAAIGIAGLTRRARSSAFEMMVFLPITLLALRHSRMLFAFGIVTGPLVSRMIADRLGPRATKPGQMPTRAFVLLLAALLCVLKFPKADTIQADIETHNPVKAVRYIREARLPGPMLNDYAWGGYLVWALPEYKTFIDPRADIFDWGRCLGKVSRVDWFENRSGATAG
jgi:hypothetical protein